MNLERISRLLGMALLVFAITGCGGKKENSVIMPGEDYQLTEQEAANKAAEMEARKSGGL